jgi:hypothetical protein
MSLGGDLSFSDVLDALAEWVGQQVGFAVFGSEGPHPVVAVTGRLGPVEMGGASDAETEWSVAKYRVGGHAFFALDQATFEGARDLLGRLRIESGECFLQIESPPGGATVDPEELGQAGEGLPSYPAPRYSILASQFNRLLDQGLSMTSEETRGRIEDRSLFDYLESQYSGEPHWLDLSIYKTEQRDAILATFEAINGELGVWQNGLALCAAYCVEVLQSPDSYRERN